MSKGYIYYMIILIVLIMLSSALHQICLKDNDFSGRMCWSKLWKTLKSKHDTTNAYPSFVNAAILKSSLSLFKHWQIQLQEFLWTYMYVCIVQTAVFRIDVVCRVSYLKKSKPTLLRRSDPVTSIICIVTLRKSHGRNIYLICKFKHFSTSSV